MRQLAKCKFIYCGDIVDVSMVNKNNTFYPKLLPVCWSKTFRPNNNYTAMKVVTEIRLMEIKIR